MKIQRKKKFRKQYEKLSKKWRKKVDEKLLSFSRNPFTTSLKNHALKGKYQGMRSVSVSGDLRIIFQEKDNYIVVILINLGTHSKVYKK